MSTVNPEWRMAYYAYVRECTVNGDAEAYDTSIFPAHFFLSPLVLVCSACGSKRAGASVC